MTHGDIKSDTHGERKWKEKLSNASSFDNGVLDHLQRIIANVDLSANNLSNDYQPIIEFCGKDLPFQVIQAWSYYAQTNNHQKFTEASIKIYKMLKILNSDTTLHEYGSAIITSIITNYTKVLYRGLNNGRPSITNPILHIMKEVVSFNNGCHVDDFLSFFDLSLSSISKLLTPHKAESFEQNKISKTSHLSMRLNFINFWLSLIEHAHPLLRTSILTENVKIMNNWIKYMNKLDPPELLIQTINVFINSVLKEKSFKKTIKCKVLNEALICKFHTFYHSSNNDLIKEVNNFFSIYTSDPIFSIVFNDNKLWFDDPISDKLGNINKGVLVISNKKQFRIYNKLLYTMLTFFKPWEDDLQLSMVLNVLENVPELVAPYCNFLASRGTHDPKMTSYWFSCTLLLGRIINLPIPSFIRDVHVDMVPVPSLVLENIVPSPITKTVFVKCLKSEIPLIKQLGCQLIVFCFKKFEEILNLYTIKGWDSSTSLLKNVFYELLPELSLITTVMNEVYTNYRSNKILSLSLTMILKYYSKNFPNFFNISLPSTNIYGDIMKLDAFKGIDLVILDNFLQYQELNDAQTKWWLASQTEHSLFASLLKLSSSKNTSNIMITKITSLIDNLIQYTIIFDFQKLWASPISALINSLSTITNEDYKNINQLEKIWKLIDETISRVVKMPYKYVDISKTYDDVSPFVVALCEQWGYLDKITPYDMCSKWLLIFMRNLIMINESVVGIKSLAHSLSGIDRSMIQLFLDFDDYELGLGKLITSDGSLTSHANYSFFQYITLTKLKNLAKLQRFPVTSLDAAGLVFRICSIVENDNISLDRSTISFILDDLLSKIGKFALTNNLFALQFIQPKFYNRLVLTPSIDIYNSLACEKYMHTTIGIIHIYMKLNLDISPFVELLFNNFVTCYSKWINELSLRKALHVSCSIFSEKLLVKIIELDIVTDSQTMPIIIAMLLSKKCVLNNEIFISILSEARTEDLIQLLSDFIKENLVQDLDVESVISIALKNHLMNNIIESILANPGAIKYIQPYLSSIQSEDLIISICLYLEDSTEKDIIGFLKRGICIATKLYKNSKPELYKKLMSIFYNGYDFLTEIERHNILEFITCQYTHKYNVSTIRFIQKMDCTNNKLIAEWMNKSVLFITKNFSERLQLSSTFLSFITEFQNILLKKDLWKILNCAALNAQLEVILSKNWINQTEVLEYLNIFILGVSCSKIDSNRLLQVLINNSNISFFAKSCDSYMRFLTSAIIYNLFIMDIPGNSSIATQERLLFFYNGTPKIEDRIIFQLLEMIESNTNRSWVDFLYSWEFMTSLSANDISLIGTTKLLEKKREGFVITLDKNIIENTILDHPFHLPVYSNMPGESVSKQWSFLQNFYKKDCLHYKKRTYDPLFLQLLIINNQEFIKKVDSVDPNGYSIDIKKMLDNKIFQVVINSLCNNGECFHVALSLISQMLNSLKNGSSFKYGHIIKIFLSKIAYTFYRDNNDQEKKSATIPPLIWLTISRLAEILSQPSSVLYEKACRWVLSYPYIRSNDIPLFHQLMLFKSSDDTEKYYTHLKWVLESINYGLKTEEDMKLLKSLNILEWIMNLQNSPYLNLKINEIINSIIYKIQNIDGGGAALITRFAGISYIDARQENLHDKFIQANLMVTKNNKNKNHLKDLLILQQQILNNSELGLRYSIIINSQKRLNNWIDDNTLNIVKRVCK